MGSPASPAILLITRINGWGKEHNLTIFERDSKGRFIRRKSRGHIYSSHCVVNSLPMMEALRLQAKEKQVQFLERTMVTDLVKANEAKSMVPVAEAFLHSSLLRQESRGFHFREDFPCH